MLNAVEQQSPASIKLGLDRVSRVYKRLGSPRPAARIVTVAGTNGKGSTLQALEYLLRDAGLRTGRYTSPHFLHFNERYCIDGTYASDEAICDSLKRVLHASDPGELTYFEVTTLVALELMASANLDVALLEVGLGGRLDAVNILDADIAVVASISMDHTDWLGDTREKIGYEKAGIARAGKPLFCGDRQPPKSLIDHCKAVDSKLEFIGTDFDIWEQGSPGWRGQPIREMQLHPDACALALRATEHLGCEITPAMLGGLSEIQLVGRQQQLEHQGRQVILDVAHNQASTEWLERCLKKISAGIWGVFGIVNNKDVGAVVGALANRIQHWVLCDLPTSSNMPSPEVQAILADRGIQTSAIKPDPQQAFASALQASAPGDCIVAFGSFYTVSGVMQYLQIDPRST